MARRTDRRAPGARLAHRGRAVPRRILALVALVALLLPLSRMSAHPVPARAAAPTSMPGAPVELRASGRESATFVAPPDTPDTLRLAAASFIVTYTGFSAEAQAAFQRAVDIWSSLLTSPVPIRVQATWTPLPPGVLGSAGPVDFFRDFTGAPRAGTWYPAALANKLRGADLDPGAGDIAASFSSDFAPNFYFGSGATPAGKLNFTSVVLHELGHGLGFSGTLRVSGGQGNWGNGTGYPTIYDRFAESGAGQALLNTALYPNPSAALAGALQSNSVWFDGPQVAAAGGGRAALFAPASWQQGSSFSHFDEATFAPGNANSLMTPYLDNGESIYSPGPVGLALLADLGWTLGGGAASPCGGFADVPDDHPACAAIAVLAGQNIIRGYATNPPTFGPADAVQRAQMAAFIMRALAWQGEPTGPRTFTDFGALVAELRTASLILANKCDGDLCAARGYEPAGCASRGLASPCFGPNDGVTKAQVISLVARAFQFDETAAWAPQPGQAIPYTGIPDVHLNDVRTYHHYAGTIPDAPSTSAGWNSVAPRAWVAMVLYQALQAAP